MIFEDMIFDNIKDVIYEYACGIKYSSLKKIIEKNFQDIVEKNNNQNVNYQIIYINLINYFYNILSECELDIQCHKTLRRINIFLEHLSEIISNNENKKLIPSNVINKTITDIEKETGLFVSNIYYCLNKDCNEYDSRINYFIP